MSPITITLALPSSKLSPNSRGHWTIKSRAVKLARQQARLKTLALLAGAKAPAFAGYALAFFWPDKRHRDDDNALASCKAYRDGVADALGIDDRTLRLIQVPVMHHDKNNPRLEFTLCPL